MLLCISKESISQSFAIAQKKKNNILLTGGAEVALKGMGGK